MRKGILSSLGALVAGAGTSLAQAPAPVVPASGTPQVISAAPAAPKTGGCANCAPSCSLACAPCCPCSESCAEAPRFWASADYLLWWVKDGPSHYPFLTTSPPASAGILGAPGTTVLFGGSDFDFGTFSGLRLTLGGLDPSGSFGMEGSAFLLERRAIGYQATTTPLGPILARPFISQVPLGFPALAPLAPPLGSQFSTAALVPGLPTTLFQATVTTRLWGGEANLTSSRLGDSDLNLRLLAGFRYLDLYERIDDAINFFAVMTQGNDRAGSFGRQTEEFHARSQFYGGQVGGQAEARMGRLFVNLVGKVALGSSHEINTINGTQVLTPPEGGPISVLPNSLFAKASNIGRTKADAFAVVPEVNLNVGFALNDNILAYVGYNFLYWSDVIRPGDQIDPNVNTLFPINIGAPFPAPKFSHTDFWAHGVNFGMALRF